MFLYPSCQFSWQHLQVCEGGSFNNCSAVVSPVSEFAKKKCDRAGGNRSMGVRLLDVLNSAMRFRQSVRSGLNTILKPEPFGESSVMALWPRFASLGIVGFLIV